MTNVDNLAVLEQVEGGFVCLTPYPPLPHWPAPLPHRPDFPYPRVWRFDPAESVADAVA